MSQSKSSSKKKPPSEKGAGQATLFSFFAKAPAKAGSSPPAQAVKKAVSAPGSGKAAPAAKAAKPSAASSKGKSATAPKLKPAAASAAPSNGSSAVAAAAAGGAGAELIGQSIEVYWTDDKQWNAAVVSAYSAADSKHTLDYSAGDQERVVLSTQRWRKVDSASQDSAGAAASSAPVDIDVEQDEDEVVVQPSQRASKPKRMRVLDSDEEAELDDAPPPAAAAAKKPSKAAAAASSDAEDATWLASDASESEEEEASDDDAADSDASDSDAEGVTPGKRKKGKATAKAGSGSSGSKRLRKSSGGFSIVETKTPVHSGKKAAKAGPSVSLHMMLLMHDTLSNKL
jgi:hypothetical protein